MISLPPLAECRRNKESLINRWLQTAELSAEDITEQVLALQKHCEDLLVYHTLLVPPNAETNEDFKNALNTRYLMSNRLKPCVFPASSRICQPDKKLGLDDYVYFTVGHPSVPTLGNQTIVFAVPFSIFSNKAQYPEYWASWGDIASLASKIYPSLSWSCLTDEQYRYVSQIYVTRIFPVSDIPELVAYFLITHNKEQYLVTQKLRKAWHDCDGNHGPEIKVRGSFPLQSFTHCFINSKHSLAGKIANCLYNNRLINCTPMVKQLE